MMKNKKFKLVTATICCVLIITATACATVIAFGKDSILSTKNGNTTNVGQSINTEVNESYNAVESQDSYDEAEAMAKKARELEEWFRNVTPNESQTISIPLYSKDRLIFDLKSELHLGQDLTNQAFSNALSTYVGTFLYYFPDLGVRAFTDGRKYLVSELDGGDRVFVFYGSENSYKAPLGRAIIVGKVHSLSEFAEISKGSTMSELEKIDSVTSYYRVNWTENLKLEEANLKSGKYGILYYLAEGILEVVFDGIDANGDYIVSKVELHEDYTVAGDRDISVNYKIDSLDLD